MTDVVSQILSTEESPSSDAALPGGQESQQADLSPRPDVSATAEKPARPDASATEEKPGESQTDTDVSGEDWKQKYEAAEAEKKRAVEENEAARMAYRAQEARRRQAESRLANERAARKKRVEAILGNEDKRLTIQADPETAAEFEDDLLAYRMDQLAQQNEDQQTYVDHQQVINAWKDAETGLMEWCCLKDDGPKITLAEFRAWQKDHGNAYNTQTYADPQRAVAAAKIFFRGQYIGKFTERVREIEQKSAADKAKQTLKHGASPGTGSSSLGKADQSPVERYLGSLETPAFRGVEELLRKG